MTRRNYWRARAIELYSLPITAASEGGGLEYHPHMTHVGLACKAAGWHDGPKWIAKAIFAFVRLVPSLGFDVQRHDLVEHALPIQTSSQGHDNVARSTRL